MSKEVHWLLPFVSRTGTRYMLSIYDDDYEGSPVILTGGPTPFTTDENDSEDMYEAVRSQSGTIQVCTRLSDGTTITLNDLLPSDNVARPVRLLTVDDGAIVWQGFLSCEAYNQAYTSIPDVVELPVISVLEAMDSVEVELNSNFAFLKIYGHMAYAMKAIEEKCGMALFSDVYIPSYIAEAMRLCYLYNNVYFKSEELLNEDNIIVEAHSISCKQILERIARFFGGCWREYRRDVYLELPDMSEGNEIRAFHFVNLYQAYVDPGTGSTSYIQHYISSASLAGQTWVGTGHQRSVTQGARRVKVSAELKDFECRMSLRECPTNSLVENPDELHYARGGHTWPEWYNEVYANTNETFYSLAEFRNHLASIIIDVRNPNDALIPSWVMQYLRLLSSCPYDHTIFWTDPGYYRNDYVELTYRRMFIENHPEYETLPFPQQMVYLTAFMAYRRFDGANGDLKSGLMVCGAPRYITYNWDDYRLLMPSFTLTADNYLYKQRTGLNFATASGFFKINMESTWGDSWHMTTQLSMNWPSSITIALSFGSKYAYYDTNENTYKWGDNFSTIDLPIDVDRSLGPYKVKGNWNSSMDIDEADGLFIAIPEYMAGEVAIRIYHELVGTAPVIGETRIHTNATTDFGSAFEVFISSLDIEYVPTRSSQELRTGRSSNNYMSDTGKAFRDEIEVALDMASDANNTKLATMVWDTPTSPAKLLSLGGEMKRPEVDLLNRLTAYYGEARQRLSLEMQHPATPLPLLTFDGINDGKVYAPLSESRDWQKDTSTITCYEIPNNQQS